MAATITHCIFHLHIQRCGQVEGGQLRELTESSCAGASARCAPASSDTCSAGRSLSLEPASQRCPQRCLSPTTHTYDRRHNLPVRIHTFRAISYRSSSATGLLLHMNLRHNSERRAPQIYEGDGTYIHRRADASYNPLNPDRRSDIEATPTAPGSIGRRSGRSMANIKNVRKRSPAGTSRVRTKSNKRQEEPTPVVRNGKDKDTRPLTKARILPEIFPTLGSGETVQDSKRFVGGRHEIAILIQDRIEGDDETRKESIEYVSDMYNNPETAVMESREDRRWYIEWRQVLKLIHAQRSLNEEVWCAVCSPSLYAEKLTCCRLTLLRCGTRCAQQSLMKYS